MRQIFVFAESMIVHVSLVTTYWFDLNTGINSPQLVNLNSIILIQSCTSLMGKSNILWPASLDPSSMLWTKVRRSSLTQLHKTGLEAPEDLATGHVAIHSFPKWEQAGQHQEVTYFTPRHNETYLNLSELFVQNVCSLAGVRYTADLLPQRQLNM